MNIKSYCLCMKIGERGQVTIPKDIRDKFGLGPEIDVEFHVENDSIVLRKAPRKLEIERWRGRCRASFADLGCGSVDEFMEDVRGR
jgi:AbrB family looped-hinge helix DNA binding protein